VTIEWVVGMGTWAWRTQWIIGAMVLFNLRGTEWKLRSGRLEESHDNKDERVLVGKTIQRMVTQGDKKTRRTY